jgi:hypothetical protein
VLQWSDHNKVLGLPEDIFFTPRAPSHIEELRVTAHIRLAAAADDELKSAAEVKL